MDFLTGDETGQVKLISFARSRKKPHSRESDGRSQVGKLSHKCKDRESVSCKQASPTSTVSSTPANGPRIHVLLPPTGKQNREYSVTSLAWSRRPPLEPLCDLPFTAMSEDDAGSSSSVYPTSRKEFVVGRHNGFVEEYAFPDAFYRPVNCTRRFRMPGPIVLASPCHLGEPDSPHIACVTTAGEGVIVKWTEDVWEVTAKTGCPNIVFGEGVRDVCFGKPRKGRLQRSDGALPPRATTPLRSTAQDTLGPLVDVPAVSTGNQVDSSLASPSAPWLLSAFKLPGPIGCAEVSEVEPSRLAFGGQRNLPKVMDLNTQAAVFSAKNCKADILDLADPVFVTALTFLDCLSVGGHCLGVGNANGRLYVYDMRLCGHPVLDVQICDSSRSICSISANPGLVYKTPATCGSDHCTMEAENLSEQKCGCFVWRNVTAPRLLGKRRDSTTTAKQTVALADNHGSVYLYDIRVASALRSTISHDSSSHQEDGAPAHKKRPKWEPHKYRNYDPGSIVSDTPTKFPLAYTATRRHHLSSNHGAITDFSWLHDESADNAQVVGVSVGRFAHLWYPDKKRQETTYTPIYLKNKLTRCIAVDAHSQLLQEDDDGSRTDKDSTSDTDHDGAHSDADTEGSNSATEETDETGAASEDEEDDEDEDSDDIDDNSDDDDDGDDDGDDDDGDDDIN